MQQCKELILSCEPALVSMLCCAGATCDVLPSPLTMLDAADYHAALLAAANSVAYSARAERNCRVPWQASLLLCQGQAPCLLCTARCSIPCTRRSRPRGRRPPACAAPRRGPKSQILASCGANQLKRTKLTTRNCCRQQQRQHCRPAGRLSSDLQPFHAFLSCDLK